jgi:hypothetical protein
MPLLYTDEIIYGYLKPKYAPYRAALVDPTVLPLEADVLWNEWFTGGGITDTSFIVVEEFQDVRPSNLGWSKRDYRASLGVYVTVLWINEGKPPRLNEFAKFLETYLMVAPMPTSIKSAGIITMSPTRFILSQGPPFGRQVAQVQNPEVDIWNLYMNLSVTYMQTANAPS